MALIGEWSVCDGILQLLIFA